MKINWPRYRLSHDSRLCMPENDREWNKAIDACKKSYEQSKMHEHEWAHYQFSKQMACRICGMVKTESEMHPDTIDWNKSGKMALDHFNYLERLPSIINIKEFLKTQPIWDVICGFYDSHLQEAALNSLATAIRKLMEGKR